jgi:hypothetical protein
MKTPEEWTAEKKVLFTRMYRHMVNNQDVFKHPGAPRLSDEHWNTVAWNVAWVGAEFSDPSFGMIEHVDEDGNILAVEETCRN